MAVPKRKTSRSRRGHRRSHIRVVIGASCNCSNCSALKRRHHMCDVCGFYRGRAVTSVEL